MKLVIMKIRDIFYFGLLLFSSLQGYSQEISLAGNGVTIIANASAVTGNSYFLGGINYMVVDNATVDAQVDATVRCGAAGRAGATGCVETLARWDR